jgi:uncharacterized membrane protein YkoI
MPVVRIPKLAALLIAIPLGISAIPAQSTDSPRQACLTKDAQREAVAAGRSVPLAQAIQTIRPKNAGEVVRARLCWGPNGLVYVLTLLSRNGKVTRATVDAANGVVVGGG